MHLALARVLLPLFPVVRGEGQGKTIYLDSAMSTPNPIHEPFHEGELTIQRRADTVAQGRNSGRMIADTIVPGAINFVNTQPFAVMGSVDNQQRLWASIVVGTAGFMAAEPRALDIDLSETWRIDSDPLWRNLASDPRIGILVIDLRNRARLRVNGRVTFPPEDQLHVDVEQAYPNCPQYIQRRNYGTATEQEGNAQSVYEIGTSLSDEQQQWITKADTMFVASEHPSGGIDASHRGGNPGFIQIVNSNQLRIPDYAGNGMFNTLGNLEVNPRAGVVIPDFENCRTLQLTGRTQIQWDIEDPQNETGGTRRFWDLHVEEWVCTDMPGALQWELLDRSPHNPEPIRPRE